MNKQGQILSQKQQLAISPQQLQLYALLELNSTELSDRIRKEIEENPALEEDSYAVLEEEKDFLVEGVTLDDYQDYDDAYQQDAYDSPDDSQQRSDRFFAQQRSSVSVNEQLFQQLADRELSEEERIIAEMIIGSLDDDGYFRQSLQSLSDDLLFQKGVEASERDIEEVLLVVQDFDPPGIGARHLQECLLLQLGRKRATPQLSLAYDVLQGYFSDFSNHKYSRLMEAMNITAEELQEVAEVVKGLNPKPISAWDDDFSDVYQEITPDFIIEENDGVLSVSLNMKEIMPLHVSDSFVAMLNDYQNNDQNQRSEVRDALMYTKQKIDSARWFINALQQRQESLLRVMQVIVHLQQDFFLTGEQQLLKPMILNDVADRCGLSISTVSRINSSKYADTRWGTFPLKYFFNERRMNADGEELSHFKINQKITEIIGVENKQAPLSDDDIMGKLQLEGIVIARRTVAKYREKLGFPVARLRREIL